MFYESNFTIVIDPSIKLRVFYRYQEYDGAQQVEIMRVMFNGTIVGADDLDEYYHNQIGQAVQVHLLQPTPAVMH